MNQKKEIITISSQFELTKYLFNSIKKNHLSQSERDVLLAIVNFMSPKNDWTSYPSYEKIADLALVSIRTAKSAVQVLKEKKIISYKQGRSGVSNTYSFSFEGISSLTQIPIKYSKTSNMSRHEDDDFFKNAPF